MASTTQTEQRFGRIQRLYLRIRTLPVWIRVCAILSVIGFFASTGYYLLVIRAEAKARNTITQRWQDFEATAKSGDFDGMKEKLSTILKIAPNDELAQKRLQALESGQADGSDQAMVFVTMLMNLRKGQWSEAEREAHKMLVNEPQDWFASLIVAGAQYHQGNYDRARQLLSELGPPDPSKSMISPAGLLFGFELHEKLNVNPIKLREFVEKFVVNSMRSVTSDKYPARIKVEILESYLKAFDYNLLKNPPTDDLLLGISSFSKLAEPAEMEAFASQEWAVLKRLGYSYFNLQKCLNFLNKTDRISTEQFESLTTDNQSRLQSLWEKFQELQPNDPASYHSLAILNYEQKDWRGAFAQTQEGLKKCGDDPSLLSVLVLLLRATNNAMLAYNLSHNTAVREKTNARHWLIAAECAVAAQRRDFALEACAKAREIDPNHHWAIQIEARLNLEIGDPQAAIQRFSQLQQNEILASLAVVRWYSHALLDSQFHVEFVSTLKTVEQQTIREQTPELAAEFFAGVVQAKYNQKMVEIATESCTRLLEIHGNNTALLGRHAQLTYRIASEGRPIWDTVAVRYALDSMERYSRKNPDDLKNQCQLAKLYLRGDNNTAKASLIVQPVWQNVNDNDITLSEVEYEALGEVFLADGQYNKAIQVLNWAKETHLQAHYCLLLAEAYHLQGQREKAKYELRLAQQLPKNDQDQDRYRRLVPMILGDN